MNKDYERYLRIAEKVNNLSKEASEEVLAAHPDRKDNVVFTTTAAATGPILTAYVYWVLSDAIKKGIRRLYFLARDGYVMYKIASLVAEKEKLDIECRYIYASRIAWRLPQYHLQGKNCLDKICLNGVCVTVQSMLERAHLTMEECDRVTEELNISEEERYRQLEYREILEYKEVFRKCDILFEYINSHSKAAYELAMGYFAQEGLLDEERYAIVDIGWTGSMQESIECLIGRRIEGYYFGMFGYPKERGLEGYYTFYFKAEGDVKRKVDFNHNLLECLCCAPDGMTTGYKIENDRYAPVFATKENLNLNRWDVRTQIDTVVEYAERYSEKVQVDTWEKSTGIQLTRQLCREFMIHPTRQEAECYGTFNFSDDVSEKDVRHLAVVMTKEELRENHVAKRILNRLGLYQYKNPLTMSCWIEGSIQRSGHANKWYDRLNARLFRYILYRFRQ